MINANNSLGESDGFITIDTSGHPHFLAHWDYYRDAPYPIEAGFSCNPTLVINGADVVNNSTLDNKELTAKISRAAIALKGQTMYVIVIQGATVPDLGTTVQAMGMDYAINSDAGGSSAMIYKGSYKLGPGRDVPNSIVFVER